MEDSFLLGSLFGENTDAEDSDFKEDEEEDNLQDLEALLYSQIYYDNPDADEENEVKAGFGAASEAVTADGDEWILKACDVGTDTEQVLPATTEVSSGEKSPVGQEVNRPPVVKEEKGSDVESKADLADLLSKKSSDKRGTKSTNPILISPLKKEKEHVIVIDDDGDDGGGEDVMMIGSSSDEDVASGPVELSSESDSDESSGSSSSSTEDLGQGPIEALGATSTDLQLHVNGMKEQFTRRDDSGTERTYVLGRNKVNRYYTEGCLICASKGRDRGNCGHDPLKRPACILCGVRDHLAKDCPNKLCFNCDLPGHGIKDCLEPRKSKYFQCLRCYMCGHKALDCPDRWRRYHVTVEEGPLKTSEQDTNSEAFCYNCARRGHFGHECEQDCAKGNKCPTMPFVMSYTDSSDRNTEHQARKRKRAENEFRPSKKWKADNPWTNSKPANAAFVESALNSKQTSKKKKNKKKAKNKSQKPDVKFSGDFQRGSSDSFKNQGKSWDNFSVTVNQQMSQVERFERPGPSSKKNRKRKRGIDGLNDNGMLAADDMDKAPTKKQLKKIKKELKRKKHFENQVNIHTVFISDEETSGLNHSRNHNGRPSTSTSGSQRQKTQNYRGGHSSSRGNRSGKWKNHQNHYKNKNNFTSDRGFNFRR